MSDSGVRVDLTEAQRLTELDERIEAAAKALYADNRSQWDSPEFEWLHPDMQSRYRAVVAKVIAVAGLPGLIGELTEARQQLETAQAEIVELKQAIWDGCHQLGFDTDGDPTPVALVHPPLGQLLAQVIADHMAIDVEADCEYADLEATIARVRALHQPVDHASTDCPWASFQCVPGQMVCSHCQDDGGGHIDYPCATIAALDGECPICTGTLGATPNCPSCEQAASCTVTQSDGQDDGRPIETGEYNDYGNVDSGEGEQIEPAGGYMQPDTTQISYELDLTDAALGAAVNDSSTEATQ